MLLPVSETRSSLPDKESFLVTYVIIAFGKVGVPGESSSAVELREITGGAARIKVQI